MNVRTVRAALLDALEHMRTSHGGAMPGSRNQLLTQQIEDALAIPLSGIPLKTQVQRWLASGPDLSVCQVAFGKLNSEGYGTVHIGGKNLKQHRHAFELYHRRKIPTGWELRSHCRHRWCINPTHWEELPKALAHSKASE